MSGIMSMVLGARTAIAAAVDEFFNRVTLLLPGDGTNGAQNNTFLDSSSNNFTITRNGNTTQGTFSPFSQTGWSNYFDGSSAYLTLADNVAFEPGTGDFTIEAWVYDTVAAGTLNVYIAHASSGVSFYRNASGKLEFAQDAVAALATSTNNIPVNSWNHIAVSRSGTSLKLFINGVQEASVTNSTNLAGTGSLGIGASSNGSNKTTGYISNLRLVKGTAVYTASFTPPTAALTAISGTSLLTCQDNRFRDASSNAFALTVNGTPSVQAFSPFAPTAAYSAATNGGSGYFDGTGDYLTAPDNAAFSFGSGNFTIELWAYLNSSTSGVSISFASQGTSAFNTDSSWYFLRHSSDKLRFISTADGGSTTVIVDSTNSFLPAVGQWYHLAVVRNGTTVTLYVDGVSVGSGTNSITFYDSTRAIGIGSSSAGEGPINGYISNLRIVKGTAVYTAAFTPPTAPLTAITNTQLLLSATNAGITDATAKNVLETVGNAQISTTQSKFGGSSMYFDGTGDYLIAPSSASSPIQSFSLPGDFTIECWVRSSSFATNQGIFDTRNSGASTLGVTVFFDTSNKINLFMNGLTRVTSTATYSTNTWYHIAVVRSGTTNTLYVDGTSVGTYTFGTSLTDNSLTIGSVVDYRDTTSTYKLNGYIDDFRITKGYARYTSSFTPPTAAFALQ